MKFDELQIGDIFLSRERTTNVTYRCVKTADSQTKNNARAVAGGMSFHIIPDWPFKFIAHQRKAHEDGKQT